MKLASHVICAVVLVFVSSAALHAQTISWKGHTWTVNNGSPMGSSGAGQISGSASNVSIDGSGYLHLKISGSGSTATGSEIISTDKIGFGSIYYVFQGAVTSMQPQVVLAGFTYGPAAGVGVDGEDELDIEFSKWNNTAGNINGDFAFYPATGHGTGVSSFGDDWLINLNGSTVNTCRIDWSSTKVTASVWTGVVATNAPTSTAIKSDTYNGTTTTIPQAACPMMFNLWTFGAKPTQALDIAVQDYQFIAAGSTTGGTTGATGGGTIGAGLHQLAPNCATGSRLDDSGARTTNGNNVVLYTANNTNAQIWNFASIGTNVWNLAVNLGPYCLDDRGSTTSGTQVGIWSCVGNTNQAWTSSGSSSGYVFKAGNGLCLDVAGALAADNTPIQTYTCNGTNAQAWTLH